MSVSSGPSSEPSPEGRRVLVTGDAGDRIQAWRLEHDPEQAIRIPPHTTLCYWIPPALHPAAFDAQVRHAVPAPIEVRLGEVRRFDPAGDGSIYVALEYTHDLGVAKARLYDGSHLALPHAGDWPWHVTCVRSPEAARGDALLGAAQMSLSGLGSTTMETIELLELRSRRYDPIAAWRLVSRPVR